MAARSNLKSLKRGPRCRYQPQTNGQMQPPIVTEFLNGRLSERASTSTIGVVMSEDGTVRMDCILSNVSSTGARLLVASTKDLPEHLVIEFEASGIRWPCQVVRRSASDLGVRFK